MDYPFTIVQMQIGPDSRGTGTLSLFTKVLANEDTIYLENFASAPVMLTDIRAKKDSEWRKTVELVDVARMPAVLSKDTILGDSNGHASGVASFHLHHSTDRSVRLRRPPLPGVASARRDSDQGSDDQRHAQRDSGVESMGCAQMPSSALQLPRCNA